MKNRFLVYLMLLFAMLFWSISYIWSKIVFTVYSPITTIFLRLVLASVFFLAVGLISRTLQRPRRGDLKFILLLSVFQPFLYFLGENMGLYHLTPTIVAIVVSTIPLFVAFAEFYFFHTRLTPVHYLGILISITGVALVLYQPGSSRTDIHGLGIGFLLLAVGAAVAYSVLIVKKTRRYSPFTLVTYQNLVGIAYFLPLFLILDWRDFISTRITMPVVLALGGLAIFSSSLAFIFFVHGLKEIGITRASIFGNLIPPLTAGLSILILGEHLHALNYLGIALVITGVFLAQNRSRSLEPAVGE